MSATPTLCLLNGDSPILIRRFTKSRKDINEAWVRDLVLRTPEILPDEEVPATPPAPTREPIITSESLEGTSP